MAQIARSTRLLQKAEAALLSAIEVYNRPTFAYREETFAILGLNAWELLLKAELPSEHQNRMRCPHILGHHATKSGGQSKKLFLKKNRSGAALTHGLWKVITELENKTAVRVDAAVKANLEALTEIRDNAVHYVVAGPRLSASRHDHVFLDRRPSPAGLRLDLVRGRTHQGAPRRRLHGLRARDQPRVAVSRSCSPHETHRPRAASGGPRLSVATRGRQSLRPRQPRRQEDVGL
jgi:hypothetical protein